MNTLKPEEKLKIVLEVQNKEKYKRIVKVQGKNQEKLKNMKLKRNHIEKMRRKYNNVKIKIMKIHLKIMNGVTKKNHEDLMKNLHEKLIITNFNHNHMIITMNMMISQLLKSNRNLLIPKLENRRLFLETKKLVVNSLKYKMNMMKKKIKIKRNMTKMIYRTKRNNIIKSHQ